MSRRRSEPQVLDRREELVALKDPRRASGRLLRHSDMDSSYVDLADPSHLEFDYLRWMRIVLLAARARRNLHIGGGACALPRALAARDPAGLQVVCELDPRVLEMAREHFGLRRTPGLRVRQADGRQFLGGQPDASFDAVIIDAFLGALVPAALVAAETLQDVARVAPLGLVNVVDGGGAVVVHGIAANLAEAYPRVWRIAGRGANHVLVGGQLTPPARDRIRAELARDSSPAQLTR